MEEHQLCLLPVVEETGVLLGVISEAHILQAWGADPLLPVSEVMAQCGFPWEEEDEAETARLLLALEPERWQLAQGT